MKKTLAVVVGLLVVGAALLGAASYWFGTQTEKEYQALLQRSSQLGVVKLSNENYQRGIFSSAARTTVEIRDPGAVDKDAAEPVRFTLVHDIKHGPLAMGVSTDGKWQARPVLGIMVTRIELSPETQAQAQEVLGKPLDTAPIENTTTFFMGGNGESRFVIHAFSQTIGKEDKVTVNWQGLNVQMTFTANFKGFTGTMSVPGLEVAGKDGEFKMRGLESSFDVQEGIGGLPLGKGGFSVAQFEFYQKQDTGEDRFSLKGLKMESSSQASGDNINYLMSVRVDEVAADADHYGPGVFELELRKLDATSLARLQQTLQQMQHQVAQPSGSDANPMMLAQSMEIAAGLLRKSPEIEITQLSVKTSKGDLQGKAKIAFDGSKGASVSNPLTVLYAVDAQAEVSVGDRLLQEIVESFNKREPSSAQPEEGVSDPDRPPEGEPDRSSELLQTLEAQNLIIHENGKYTASASYQQGKAVLNGRQIPLQNLLP